MKIAISYEILPNGNILLKDVPDPDFPVNVEMRDLYYEEIQMVQITQKQNANVVDETYKILASIIVSWGGDGSSKIPITTLELRSKGFKVYRLLEAALTEFFLPEFEFKAE